MNRKAFLRASIGALATSAFLNKTALAASTGQSKAGSSPSSASLSSLPSGTWELIGGAGRNESWSTEARHDRARALAEFQGKLYVGIGTGEPEVWRFDGRRWVQVGGRSIMGSWPTQADLTRQMPRGSRPPWVNVLLPDPQGRHLYAGVKQTLGGQAQLWRFDGSTWEWIGGMGGQGDWNGPDYSHVYTLAWHQGNLCVGLQGHLPPGMNVQDSRTRNGTPDAQYNKGEIYSFDGTRWRKLAGIEDFPPFTHWIYKLVSFEGRLHASIVRHGAQTRFTGEVWRLNGERWERIGGEGVNASWRIPTTHIVTSMIVYKGKLFIGYNCQECPPNVNRFGNVWTWDGLRWEQLQLPVACQDPSLPAEQGSFNELLVFQGRLVVGGGHGVNAGKLAVWELADDGSQWRCLGEPGMERFVRPRDADLWRKDHYVYSMATFQDALIMGARGPAGSAHVWHYKPSASI